MVDTLARAEGDRFTILAQLEQVVNDIYEIWGVAALTERQKRLSRGFHRRSTTSAVTLAGIADGSSDRDSGDEDQRENKARKSSKAPRTARELDPEMEAAVMEARRNLHLDENNGYCLIYTVLIESCLTFGYDRKLSSSLGSSGGRSSGSGKGSSSFFGFGSKKSGKKSGPDEWHAPNSIQRIIQNCCSGSSNNSVQKCRQRVENITRKILQTARDKSAVRLTANGQARAVIRCLLNESLLSSALSLLQSRNSHMYDSDYSIMCRSDDFGLLQSLVRKLEVLDFHFSVISDAQTRLNDDVFYSTQHCLANVDYYRVKYSIPRIWQAIDSSDEDESESEDDEQQQQQQPDSIEPEPRPIAEDEKVDEDDNEEPDLPPSEQLLLSDERSMSVDDSLNASVSATSSTVISETSSMKKKSKKRRKRKRGQTEGEEDEKSEGAKKKGDKRRKKKKKRKKRKDTLTQQENEKGEEVEEESVQREEEHSKTPEKEEEGTVEEIVIEDGPKGEDDSEITIQSETGEMTSVLMSEESVKLQLSEQDKNGPIMTVADNDDDSPQNASDVEVPDEEDDEGLKTEEDNQEDLDPETCEPTQSSVTEKPEREVSVELMDEQTGDSENQEEEEDGELEDSMITTRTESDVFALANQQLEERLKELAEIDQSLKQSADDQINPISEVESVPIADEAPTMSDDGSDDESEESSSDSHLLCPKKGALSKSIKSSEMPSSPVTVTVSQSQSQSVKIPSKSKRSGGVRAEFDAQVLSRSFRDKKTGLVVRKSLWDMDALKSMGDRDSDTSSSESNGNDSNNNNTTIQVQRMNDDILINDGMINEDPTKLTVPVKGDPTVNSVSMADSTSSLDDFDVEVPAPMKVVTTDLSPMVSAQIPSNSAMTEEEIKTASPVDSDITLNKEDEDRDDRPPPSADSLESEPSPDEDGDRSPCLPPMMVVPPSDIIDESMMVTASIALPTDSASMTRKTHHHYHSSSHFSGSPPTSDYDSDYDHDTFDRSTVDEIPEFEAIIHHSNGIHGSMSVMDDDTPMDSHGPLTGGRVPKLMSLDVYFTDDDYFTADDHRHRDVRKQQQDSLMKKQRLIEQAAMRGDHTAVLIDTPDCLMEFLSHNSDDPIHSSTSSSVSILRRSSIVDMSVDSATLEAYENPSYVKQTWTQQGCVCFSCGVTLDNFYQCQVCCYTGRCYCQLCLNSSPDWTVALQPSSSSAIESSSAMQRGRGYSTQPYSAADQRDGSINHRRIETKTRRRLSTMSGTMPSTNQTSFSHCLIPHRCLNFFDFRPRLVSINSAMYLSEHFNVACIPLSHFYLSEFGNEYMHRYPQICALLDQLTDLLFLFSEINVFYKSCPNAHKLDVILGVRGYLLEAYDTDRLIFGRILGGVQSGQINQDQKSSNSNNNNNTCPILRSKESVNATKCPWFGLVSMRDIVHLLTPYRSDHMDLERVSVDNSDFLHKLNKARLQFGKHLKYYCKWCQGLAVNNQALLQRLNEPF